MQPALSKRPQYHPYLCDDGHGYIALKSMLFPPQPSSLCLSNLLSTIAFPQVSTLNSPFCLPGPHLSPRSHTTLPALLSALSALSFISPPLIFSSAFLQTRFFAFKVRLLFGLPALPADSRRDCPTCRLSLIPFLIPPETLLALLDHVEEHVGNGERVQHQQPKQQLLNGVKGRGREGRSMRVRCCLSKYPPLAPYPPWSIMYSQSNRS